MSSLHTIASRPVLGRATVLGRAGVAAMLLALAVPAVAQDPAAAPAAAPAAVDARAVFIDVAGKVQWRSGEKDQWRDAKVNDEVSSGVEVRTGLRSHAAIRLRNATVLLDAGTVFQLPSAVEDGEVIRTTAAIKHGRADFKVDKVGLSNDFKVVTPSTTLAVRGTEFAIASGPLKQVEVIGARRNAINAIELKYALNNSTVQLSGNASSSSAVNHPAHVAVVAAAPPTAAAASVPVTSQGEAVRTAAAGETPASSGSAAQIQQSNRATSQAEKASGSSGGGSNSIVSRVQAQVQEANDRADEAIAYLLRADEELVDLRAQREVMLALRDVAVARRNEASEALAAHEAALQEALPAQAAIAEKASEFEDGANAILGADRTGTTSGHFFDFTSQFGTADTLLGKIEVLVGGSGGQETGGNPSLVTGGTDLQQLIDSFNAAVTAMSGSLALAQSAASDNQMEFNRDDIVALVDSLDVGARADAADAIGAYQSAIADLAALLAEGADERAVADGARQAVAGLQALISQIAAQTPTAAILQVAQNALARLEAANAALQATVTALEQIRAAQAAAGNDPRAATLGQVQSIYLAALQTQLRVVGQWTLVENGLADRAEDLEVISNRATDIFSGQAHALRTPMESAFSSLSGNFQGLQSMSSLSTQMVAALDGAENAAEGAERERGLALLERQNAEAGELNAQVGLARTLGAIDEEDFAGAAAQNQLTQLAAAFSRSSADLAIGHATAAAGHAFDAGQFAADVNQLQPLIDAFGGNREAFEAAVANRLGAVGSSLPLLDGLRGDIAMYDNAVQQLAALAGTNVAETHVALSAAARTRADQIGQLVTQLEASLSSAEQMAETASSNAGRMFGRSVTGFVQRAQAAAATAENHAIAADAAAVRALGFAQQAATAVNATQGQN